MPFYPVKDGRQIGTFRCWPRAQAQTDHYPGSVHIRARCQEEADEFLLAYRALVRRSTSGHCQITLTDHEGRLLIEDEVESKRGRKALRSLLECCEYAVPPGYLVLVWFPFAKEIYEEETRHCGLKVRHISS